MLKAIRVRALPALVVAAAITLVPANAASATQAHPNRTEVAKRCAAKPPDPTDCKKAKDTFQSDRDATKVIVIVALAVAVAFLALFWFAGHIVIGVDGRPSTSKTVAATWTALLAGCLLAYVLAKLFGHPQALNRLLHSGLAGQYGLLIGGPLGTAVAARGIVGAQVAKNTNTKSTVRGDDGEATEEKNPLFLIQNDSGETDLGDFQYVLFNLVAMVYFVGTAIQHPLGGLPTIPDVLLGLTSVSALGYVTKKALPPAPATAALSDAKAGAGASVIITGSALLTYPEPSDTPVMVLFGDVEATTVSNKHRDATGDKITVAVPTTGLTSGQPVQVDVVTGTPARVSAGTFTLE